jgi:ribosomal protein L11 methyltransferase
MFEGLHPRNPTHVLRLVTTEAIARRVADIVMETFDPTETAAAAFENETTLQWEVEVYFAEAPDEDYMRELVRFTAGDEAAKAVFFETLAEKDWVKASLDGLSMVRAGCFLVHGSHDRHRVPPEAIGIEIEAALAFGTGHHGTTRGCLLMLDGLLKRRRPRHVLDVGTGTGVLAIAAARALQRPVAAGDIDPVAVEAAAANARFNKAGAYVRPVTAKGVDHPALKRPGHYDLIFANILKRPLMKLAPSIASVASPDADLILSGLLVPDVRGVLAAYAAQGFRLVQSGVLEGWVALRLRRGGTAPRRIR